MTTHYQSYEITCIPSLGLGRCTILCGSEEEAIATYRRIYPRADKVWADVAEREEA